MKRRGVVTMAIAASLMLAPIFARSAGAIPVAVRGGAPVMPRVGVMRAGPAMASRPMPVAGPRFSLQSPSMMTSVLPRASFPTTAVRAPRGMLPGNVVIGPLGNRLVPGTVPGSQGVPAMPVPTIPFVVGATTVRASQVVPMFPRVVAPPSGGTFSGTATSAALTMAAAATQVTPVAPTTQVTTEPSLAGTGEMVAPLDEFPLPAEATLVGEMAAPLDEGPLPPDATSIVSSEEAPIALSLDQFVSLPMSTPIALPSQAVLSPFEPGVVPLPPNVALTPPQVTFAELPPGIFGGGLQMMP